LARGSVEQAHAQARLQKSNAFTNGGGRDIELARSLREAAGVGHFDRSHESWPVLLYVLHISIINFWLQEIVVMVAFSACHVS
jgi:hypothetical protein